MRRNTTDPGPQGSPGQRLMGAPQRSQGHFWTKCPEVPKSKFRHKSQQEQTAASKLRMEKRGEKLEKAKEKLSKQNLPKAGAGQRVGRAAGGSVHGFVHGKLFEVEQENVGTEGLTARVGGRDGAASWLPMDETEDPGAPGQGCPKGGVPLYQGHGRLSLPYGGPGAPGAGAKHLETVLAEAAVPQTSAAGCQDRAAKAAKQTAAATERAGAKVAAFVKRHPVGMLLALACVLLLFMMQSCSSSLVMLGNPGPGPWVRPPIPPGTRTFWGPRPTIRAWRRSCKPTWTATPPPIAMTNTTSTWTRSSTIPMC